jgi:hypothetical protein
MIALEILHTTAKPAIGYDKDEEAVVSSSGQN